MLRQNIYGFRLYIYGKTVKCEQGKDIESLSILERLSSIGSQGRGALEYRPDESFLKTAALKDFDKISKQCQEILENKNIEKEELKELLNCAGSSGGARTKVFANFQDKEWLVNFKGIARANLGI